MMEEEIVRRRKWITREYFLDLVGATHLIPGPNSTEMAIHIGYIRAGWSGLAVAGISFILPAVVITAAFAWAYVKFGSLPNIIPFFYGIKPAVSCSYFFRRLEVRENCRQKLAAFGDWFVWDTCLSSQDERGRCAPPWWSYRHVLVATAPSGRNSPGP